MTQDTHRIDRHAPDRALACRLVLALISVIGTAVARPEDSTKSLIVVRDLGGRSALPYYQAINLLPSGHGTQNTPPVAAAPASPLSSHGEADMLPVHSTRLTVGRVERRVIAAPGLTPLFLVGDDAASYTWLREHRQALVALHAIGLVVEVRTAEGLRALRLAATGLQLVPSPADDLAQRLNLRHYPVLIMATGIEQ